jgi:hypothetical protein
MIHSLLLITHIIFGTSALLSGACAMLVRKTPGIHTKAGKIFYLSMYGAAATALLLSLINFSPFLLSIGIFTFYLTYTGKNAIDNWRRKEPLQADFYTQLPPIIGMVVALWMIANPIITMIQTNNIYVPLLAIFGTILLINAGQDFIFLRNPANLYPKNKDFLLQHIGKMGGSYIAATTAFLVNNVSLDPAWIVWLLPTFVGSFMITLAIIKWKKKLRIS